MERVTEGLDSINSGQLRSGLLLPRPFATPPAANSDAPRGVIDAHDPLETDRWPCSLRKLVACRPRLGALKRSSCRAFGYKYKSRVVDSVTSQFIYRPGITYLPLHLDTMSFFTSHPPISQLARYRTLSPLAGVRVSPIQLGAMSIGDKWQEFGLGSMDKESSFKLLDAYFDLGVSKPYISWQPFN